MTIRRKLEEIADALTSIRINNKNSKFYQEYQYSGKCMYEFAMEWLQQED